MVNSHSRDGFIVIKRHENSWIKFLKATKPYLKSFDFKNNSFSDFKQSDIGNGGLISALTTMSQRSKFLTEIALKIKQTSDDVKLHFNMFYEGNQELVTINDALPFDENNTLVYARSLQTK